MKDRLMEIRNSVQGTRIDGNLSTVTQTGVLLRVHNLATGERYSVITLGDFKLPVWNDFKPKMIRYERNA